MRGMSYAVFGSLRRFTSFVFLAIVLIGYAYRGGAPLMVASLGGVLLVAGVPAVWYSSTLLQRYKGVFDYEPTEFWGRPSNGKEARGVLLSLNTLGLFAVLAGLALLLIVRFF
jgi:hypothetical protein